ncbi:MAG: YdcF family protein [Acetobacteraceae bacterium]|nr:YdcF family protein [Acetobacteraceae bacterium]
MSLFRGRIHWPRPLRHRVVGLAIGVVVTAALAWSAGFAWFLLAIGRPVALPSHADGIIALTGGAERVETALRLLAEGRADRLLVSGTGPVTELATLGRLAGIDTSGLANRIALGRTAASTRGNAREAADWVRKKDIASLIVVTGYYHMPRALAELQPALPGVTLYPFPVGGDSSHRAALRLLAEEYSKYLVALAGVTAWLPPRELPPRETPPRETRHGVTSS